MQPSSTKYASSTGWAIHKEGVCACVCIMENPVNKRKHNPTVSVYVDMQPDSQSVYAQWSL